MKNLLRLLLLTLGLLDALLPLRAQQSLPAASGLAGRTITGRVLDGATGEALPSARVVCKGSPTTGTITDSEGRYTLANVPAQGAVLVFSAAGFRTQLKPVSATSAAPLNVALVADSSLLETYDGDEGYHQAVRKRSGIVPVTVADLRRKPATTHRVKNQATRTISGRVTDAAGRGQPGVLVQLKDAEISTCTNTDGFYSLAGVPVQGVVLLLCVLNPGTRAYIAQAVPAAAGVTHLNGVLRHTGGGPLGGPK